jgi:putative acetyltransferase
MITIREETELDLPGVRKINKAAFKDSHAADLVDALRAGGKAHLSLIAELEGKIVGHIMFTPVFLDGQAAPARGSALGPVAVRPGNQRQGVGSALIREGLNGCRHLGIDYVILLGHTSYYPRFGFVPLKSHGHTSAYGDGDHVMVHELTPGSLATLPAGAKISYQPEFQQNGC